MNTDNCNQELRFYTVREVMKMMRIGKNLAYDFIQQVYIEQSPFPVIKIGSTYRIPKESFDQYSRKGHHAEEGSTSGANDIQ